jgi:hypothetical protein
MDQHLIFWFLDGICKYNFLAFLGKSEGKRGEIPREKESFF